MIKYSLMSALLHLTLWLFLCPFRSNPTSKVCHHRQNTTPRSRTSTVEYGLQYPVQSHSYWPTGTSITNTASGSRGGEDPGAWSGQCPNLLILYLHPILCIFLPSCWEAYQQRNSSTSHFWVCWKERKAQWWGTDTPWIYQWLKYTREQA